MSFFGQTDERTEAVGSCRRGPASALTTGRMCWSACGCSSAPRVRHRPSAQRRCLTQSTSISPLSLMASGEPRIAHCRISNQPPQTAEIRSKTSGYIRRYLRSATLGIGGLISISGFGPSIATAFDPFSIAASFFNLLSSNSAKP